MAGKRFIHGITIILLAGLFPLIFCDDEETIEPGSKIFIELCVKAFNKFEYIKSQHYLIKSMIDDSCKEEYIAMTKEIYPIAEKFLADKPDEAALTENCKSEQISQLFIKYMKVFKCLRTLAEQFGES